LKYGKTGRAENTSSVPLQSVAVRLEMPEGMSAQGEPRETRLTLRPKEAKSVTWEMTARKLGLTRLILRSEAGEACTSDVRWLSVVARRDPAHEYETATGAWRPFPERPTLQEQNDHPMHEFRTRSSVQLRRNLFGITAHLPRSGNDENPFVAAHVVDGDPATCWASRWWRTAIPFRPEWIEVDLGRTWEISELRFLPAWKNSAMPAALRIAVSQNGRRWDTLVDEPDYRPQGAPQGDALRCGDLTWQRFTFAKQRVRHVRFEADRLTQKGTSFFCAPFEPFQFRVSDVAVCNSEGKPIDLAGLKTTASSTHWQGLFLADLRTQQRGRACDKSRGKIATRHIAALPP